MKIKSFAKINLGLEVIGKREDSYHEIRTLFQTIDFFDVIEFQQIQSDKILIQGDDRSISWDKENLIFKAALLLKDQFHLTKGIKIHVTKNIPAGKGLGGGSSNAAITLFALNKIWELGLEKNSLNDFGKQLGADVPFFLEGGLCLGLGRGDDIFSQVDLSPFYYCLLVFPSFPISTAHIYSHFRLTLTSKDKDSKIIKFLNTRLFGSLENRLEETVFRFYPQLKALKNFFLNQGAKLSLVSGTGSAVFGLFSDRERAEKARRGLEKEYTSFIARTLSRKDYWKSLFGV